MDKSDANKFISAIIMGGVGGVGLAAITKMLRERNIAERDEKFRELLQSQLDKSGNAAIAQNIDVKTASITGTALSILAGLGTMAGTYAVGRGIMNDDRKKVVSDAEQKARDEYFSTLKKLVEAQNGGVKTASVSTWVGAGAAGLGLLLLLELWKAKQVYDNEVDHVVSLNKLSRPLGLSSDVYYEPTLEDLSKERSQAPEKVQDPKEPKMEDQSQLKSVIDLSSREEWQSPQDGVGTADVVKAASCGYAGVLEEATSVNDMFNTATALREGGSLTMEVPEHARLLGVEWLAGSKFASEAAFIGAAYLVDEYASLLPMACAAVKSAGMEDDRDAIAAADLVMCTKRASEFEPFVQPLMLACKCIPTVDFVKAASEQSDHGLLSKILDKRCSEPEVTSIRSALKLSF